MVQASGSSPIKSNNGAHQAPCSSVLICFKEQGGSALVCQALHDARRFLQGPVPEPVMEHREARHYVGRRNVVNGLRRDVQADESSPRKFRCRSRAVLRPRGQRARVRSPGRSGRARRPGTRNIRAGNQCPRTYRGEGGAARWRPTDHGKGAPCSPMRGKGVQFIHTPRTATRGRVTGAANDRPRHRPCPPGCRGRARAP